MSRGIGVLATGSDGPAQETLAPLLAVAHQLAERVGDDVSLWYVPESGDPAELGSLGVDRVTVVRPDRLEQADAGGLARTLAPAIAERDYSVLLFPDTVGSGPLAARLAARLGAGLAAGATHLERRSDGSLLVTRPAYSRRASCVVEFTRSPQMATVLVDALPPVPPPERRKPVIEDVKLDALTREPGVEVIGEVKLDAASLPLREAQIVLGAGLGAGLPETLPLLERLARALNASLAGSRPVVDRGWLPGERLVGQSGKIISPALYIACGISGSPQHLVGMRDAKAVLALNRDPGAPIMAFADLALVGDCEPVLGRLLDLLGEAEPGDEPREAPA